MSFLTAPQGPLIPGDANFSTVNSSGVINVHGKNIVFLANPTSAQDAVTKIYVDTGLDIQGLPPGGTAGQVLAKIDDTNYNTEWTTASSSQNASNLVSSTGLVSVNTTTPTSGQILIAVSPTEAIWQTPTGGGVSSVQGTSGQIDVIPTTGNCVVSMDPTYLGQTSITTIGNITIGTWNANYISLASGGTGASLTASPGGIFYSTASAGAILSGTSTSGQMLQSGASAAPMWSTTVWPSTTTGNQLLYSSTNNVLTGLSTEDSAVLITSAGGVPTWSSPMANGQIIIGQTGSTPTVQSLMGDATLDNSGNLTLATVNTDTGVWGSSTQVPQFTVNAKGLITAVSQVAITGASPVGSSLASGDIWVGDASNTAQSVVVTGDATMSNAGTLTLATVNVSSGLTTLSSVTTNAKGLVTSNVTGNLTGAITSVGLTTSYNTTVPMTMGGTGASLTANQGGIFYSTASQGAVLNGTSTAGQMLQSGASGPPTWSTSSWPSSTTSNQVLYSGATNTVTGNTNLNFNGTNLTIGNSSGILTQGPYFVGSGATGDAQQGSATAMVYNEGVYTALIGGPRDLSNQGSAWIFQNTGGGWQQVTKLNGSGASSSAYFGYSVSMVQNGSVVTALIGGYNNTGGGAVWIFQSTLAGASGWTQIVELSPGSSFFGYSVSMVQSGSTLTAAIGSPFDNGTNGALWIYQSTTGGGSGWALVGSKLVGSGAIGAAQQGYSTCIVQSGSTLTAVSGGYYDNGGIGAAWVWQSTTGGGSGWTQLYKLIPSGNSGNASFGYSSTLLNSAIVAVGGPNDNSNVGAVWIFKNGSQVGSKLTPTGYIGSPYLGFTNMAITNIGNICTLLVGGIYDNGSIGAVWMFQSPNSGNSGWALVGSKIVPTGGGGQVGSSVSLITNGTSLAALIGANSYNSSVGGVWFYYNVLMALGNGDVLGTTITDPSNIVAANLLVTPTGLVSVDTTTPTTGQILTATGGTAATWQTPTAKIYADFYDSSPTSSISVGSYWQLLHNGPSSGQITRGVTQGTFVIPTTGVWWLTFTACLSVHGQVVVVQNGTELLSTTAGNSTATDPTVALNCILSLNSGDIIGLHNPTGNTTAYTLLPANGAETYAYTAHLVILQVA